MERQAQTYAPAPGQDFLSTDNLLAMSDGQQLFVRHWQPEQPSDAVLIVHGLGEHSGRYEKLAQWFCARGFAVCSYDQRGHGCSNGQRGALRRDDDLLTDLATVYNDYAAKLPRAPILLGHSMGGLVAARAVLDLRIQPRLLVLSSPALRSYESPWMQRLARMLSRVAPNLSLRNGLKLEGLSHDAQVIAAYRSDPLCTRAVTPRLANFIFTAGTATIEDAWNLRTPTLLVVAGSDRLVDPKGSRDFSAGASSSGFLTSRFFDTLFHELFNESEQGRQQVLLQLGEWLRRNATV